VRRTTGIAVLLLLAAWLTGLLWFSLTLPDPVPVAVATTRTDGLIVLTGGRGRLDVGFRLLAAGRASRLLVSGVHPATRLADLAVDSGLPQRLLDCCVDLGRQAGDTIGNAVEGAAWARRNRLTSVRLITSDDHMRRALFELQARAPRLRIVPHPVASTHALPRLAVEFTKTVWRRCFLLLLGP